ncbi:MAG: hypothetical protein FWE62_02015 [Firmicutes bacterium]|nr:hypothetical protein [Bacillota bacterium]
MRKSVILMIAVIFVLGVVLVNMFGMKFYSFVETVYPEKIVFTGEKFTVSTVKGERYRSITKTYAADNQGLMTIQLYWEITPADASDSVILRSDNDKVTVNQKGLVVISEYVESFVITVTAESKTTVKDRLMVFLNMPEGK